MINKVLLQKILNNIEENKLSNISIKTIEDVRIELESTIKTSLSLLYKTNLKEVIEFILWNDIWNQYGIYGTDKFKNRNNSSINSYSRGRLLLIDFGNHNIGLEFSLEHMGVVIRDFDGLLEVVPITSDHGQIYNKHIENVIIRIKKDEYPQFNNDSILLIHQIQSIGKNRIVRDIGQSIAFTPLMELLEEKISKTYSPFKMKNISEEINKLKKDIKIKDEEIKCLQSLLEQKQEIMSEKIYSVSWQIIKRALYLIYNNPTERYEASKQVIKKW